MSEEVILYCNDPKNLGCSWSGNSDELICTDEDPDNFTHCPNCKGMDFEEEEEEE
jgi:hypothetical protein